MKQQVILKRKGKGMVNLMAGSHPLNTYKKMKEMTEVTNLTQIDTIFAFENSITKM